MVNPSDTYTITIRRSNSYGDTDGTFNLIVNNLTAPADPITGFTLVSGSTALVNSDTLADGSVVDIDDTLTNFERIIFEKEYVETYILPSLTQSGDKYIIGKLNSGADVSSLELTDYDFAISWEYVSATSHNWVFYRDGSIITFQTINSLTQSFYDYAIEIQGTSAWLIACNANAINTEPSPSNGGSFTNAHEVTAIGSAPHTISIGNIGSDSSFGTTGTSELIVPAPSNWIQVSANPSHTLQFDGSTTMPTLQAGYTYRFLMGDTTYANLTTSTGLHGDDDLRFTSDGSTEYTTGITRVGNPNDTDTFGAYTAYVEFVVPSDVPPLQWYTDHNGIGSATGINISGSTYVTPVTGITLEGPSANQTGTNLFDLGDYGWLSLNETLSAGERLVLDNAFIINLVTEMPSNSLVSIGLKDSDWNNGNNFNDGFVGGSRFTIVNNGNGSIQMYSYYSHSGVTSQSNIFTININSIASLNVEAFLELTSSGNNVRSGYRHDYGGISSDSPSTTTYADWTSTRKMQTGDKGFGLTSVDVVIQARSTNSASGPMDSSDIDWTGISEINIPTPAIVIDTPWSKALDFSGSNEHAKQVSSSTNYMPIGMDGLSATVSAPSTSGNTSGHIYSRPWATAIVFKADGNNSNQHIWNQGEGAGSTDDNIYLRMDANGQLYFGWGRTGALNECALGSTTTGRWYGIYIAHNGTRLSGSNATAANLADAFDIRITTEIGNWTGATYNYSKSFTWSTTGGRMDRSVTSNFTVGGRGANRNFHGKIASMVVTTLRVDQPMPDTTEIEMMISDPMKWLEDYKDGNTYRVASSQAEATFGLFSYLSNSAFATQVWLMGDGTLDNYSNHIRNQVYPNDQNYTKLNMISMVSNDIENVNINGLS